MVDAGLHELLLQTLTLSLAVVAVRALQGTLLRPLGAAARYLCWLLVPVAMLAAALPHPAVDALVVHVDVSAVAPAWVAAPPEEGAGSHGLAMTAVAVAWLAGMGLFAVLLLQRQRRFESLVATAPDDAAPRLPAGAGPAVLGVWRRRIVLPRDFDSAFDAEERRLMLLHEGLHLRRGDNAWNLLASALLVTHWFNPIAWWAWRRVRADQELSCDAAVLRRESPAALAAYAGALLKVQGVAFAAPLATSWQSSHPLVERVRMLKVHRISSGRHRAGLRVATLLVLVAGLASYALRAGASASAEGAAVMTAVQVKVGDGSTWSTPAALQLLTRAGEPALLRLDRGTVEGLAAPLEIAFTASRLDAHRVRIDTTLRSGSPLATLASPRLITHDGETASVSVRVEGGAQELAVSFTPKLVAGALPALPPLPAAAPAAALPPLPAVPAAPAAPARDALPALPAPPPPPALQRAV